MAKLIDPSRPNDVEFLEHRALAAYKGEDFASALEACEQGLALQSDHVRFLFISALCLFNAGQAHAALTKFDALLSKHPRHLGALNGRGTALASLKRDAEAVEAFEQALLVDPHSVEVNMNLGALLAGADDLTGALAAFDRVLLSRPDHAGAHAERASALARWGRFAQAKLSLERAIALTPEDARLYRRLAEFKTFSTGDPHLRAMEALALRGAARNVEQQIDISFALAKAYADIGDAEKSFPYLLEGNARMREHIVYDEAALLETLERTRQTFDAKFLSAGRGLGDPSRAPVFIFGMPRSGTSLVEHILASHPDIHGAGEISALDDAVGSLGLDAQAREAPIAIMAGDWRRLGADYVARVRRAAPDKARITDKNTENFRFAGLIHLALPNARLIHVRRNPIDTCLSCFYQSFAGNLNFTYDLGELGRFYAAYAKLMAHWREVLPAEILLEVRYEDIVADLEPQARRLVAHAGLEWDRRCLDFHKTERPVRTASKAQVRRPIYQTSLGRWRDYEPFLTPLLKELRPFL